MDNMNPAKTYTDFLRNKITDLNFTEKETGLNANQFKINNPGKNYLETLKTKTSDLNTAEKEASKRIFTKLENKTSPITNSIH